MCVCMYIFIICFGPINFTFLHLEMTKRKEVAAAGKKYLQKYTKRIFRFIIKIISRTKGKEILWAIFEMVSQLFIAATYSLDSYNKTFVWLILFFFCLGYFLFKFLISNWAWTFYFIDFFLLSFILSGDYWSYLTMNQYLENSEYVFICYKE